MDKLYTVYFRRIVRVNFGKSEVIVFVKKEAKVCDFMMLYDALLDGVLAVGGFEIVFL